MSKLYFICPHPWPPPPLTSFDYLWRFSFQIRPHSEGTGDRDFTIIWREHSSTVTVGCSVLRKAASHKAPAGPLDRGDWWLLSWGEFPLFREAPVVLWKPQCLKDYPGESSLCKENRLWNWILSTEYFCTNLNGCFIESVGRGQTCHTDSQDWPCHTVMSRGLFAIILNVQNALQVTEYPESM